MKNPTQTDLFNPYVGIFKSPNDQMEFTKRMVEGAPENIGAIKGLVFDGPDYNPDLDNARLTGQVLRVFDCMKDGKWRTLSEIEEITKDPAASISAQLRHLRKSRFGAHTINKQRRGNRSDGLFEYQLIVNKKEDKC